MKDVSLFQLYVPRALHGNRPVGKLNFALESIVYPCLVGIS